MFFQENGQYRCAVYLRLSRSDGDQQESNSIKNQRALLNDYLGKHPELHKVDEYVDDGYSGTNFERPDFKRMMQDIENRKINCIIVKDDCVIIEPTQKDLENQGFVAGSICF